MKKLIPVTKNTEAQEPVPSIWRATFVEIVSYFVHKDFTFKEISHVSELSDQDVVYIEESIANYGDPLISLPEEAWNTSVCQWMGTYWDVLIDLYTENGRSDLVLHVRVHEVEKEYFFKVLSVYTP